MIDINSQPTTQAPLARRTDSARSALAAEIARELFTDGTGKRATRLMLTIGGWPSSSGWSETEARDAIERVLAKSPNAPGSRLTDDGRCRKRAERERRALGGIPV